MKTCRACGDELPLTQFYTHPDMADGHVNRCKDCVRSRVRIHRESNIKKIREYDRARSTLSHRVSARKVYAKSSAGKKAHTLGSRAWRKRNPDKYRAQNALNNAIRDKKLSKGVCEVCGCAKVQGHHDDYTKPLDVRWLCDFHHKVSHSRR